MALDGQSFEQDNESMLVRSFVLLHNRDHVAKHEFVHQEQVRRQRSLPGLPGVQAICEWLHDHPASNRMATSECAKRKSRMGRCRYLALVCSSSTCSWLVLCWDGTEHHSIPFWLDVS